MLTDAIATDDPTPNHGTEFIMSTSRSTSTGISTGLVLFLAVATGLSVANLYYAQPLLHTIADAFGVGEGKAGLVVTLTQIGYAIGLALLVPLGDIVQRRKLTAILLTLAGVALVISATSSSVTTLIALAVFVGIGSVSTQILIPLAANMATDAKRGQVVGMVMTGVLLGILLARTISGLVAGAFGWRTVYWAAAVVAFLLAIVLLKVLPADTHTTTISYPALLKSTVALIGQEPVLRRRMLFGALNFGAFSALWTTIAFLLSEPPFDYGDAVVGLFGLVGVAGALSGNFAGRFVDRGLHNLTTAVFAIANIVAFAIMGIGKESLALLIIGVLILDIGVQGMQITNQSVIYQLAPGARSRITANYMTANFLGGAIGSALASAVYESSAGWPGVMVLGIAAGAITLIVHGVFGLRAGSAASESATGRA